jgi:tryptophan 2,3-dioxygenase
MRDSEVSRYFAELPIEELRHVQLASGRQAVPLETREFWRNVHEIALDVLRDDRRSHRAMALAEFVRVITFSLSKLIPADTKPTYYTYTDVALLDWFLARERPTFADIRRSSLTGIIYLLEDVAHFESDSQSGIEKRFHRSFNHDISSKRVALIRDVVREWEQGSDLMAGHKIDDLRGVPRGGPVNHYVDEPERKAALVRFSCFPQTECHDEYVFLRTIHMSEFAFTGIQSGVEEAIEWLKVGNYQEAERPLQAATSFAAILHSIFRVLNTMPKEHFAEFRDATGDASAVQSRNYQLMEVFCCGVNQQKLETFKRIQHGEHLQPLSRYGDRRFRSLRDILNPLRDEPDAAATVEAARKLDKVLLSWRGLHLAFAKTYLPAETVGTGGTHGASYLQRFLKQTIFTETTFEAVKLSAQFPDFSEIFEAMRYEPTSLIAPPERPS